MRSRHCPRNCKQERGTLNVIATGVGREGERLRRFDQNHNCESGNLCIAHFSSHCDGQEKLR